MNILVPLVFYAFAAILVAASVMVIVSRNPVRGALFLILAFFCSAVLWLLLEAEFLALALIFVYVGAVMTLFLFVVMMLNIDKLPDQEGFVKFLPIGVLVMAVLVGLMIMVIGPHHFSLNTFASHQMHSSDYSNVAEVGDTLYTQYVMPFELAGMMLLVAIISSISLAHRVRRPNTRTQDIPTQIATHSEDQLIFANVDEKSDPFANVKIKKTKKRGRK